MTTRPENKSATVPLAQQAEATLARWRWVEPSVWTVRMLTALEQGVKGTKWFRLFDKVFAERNLFSALQDAARNDGASGVDHVTVTEFVRQSPEAIWELMDSLQADLDDRAYWTPTMGAPQGAVLSPLLSNIYLDPLDH